MTAGENKRGRKEEGVTKEVRGIRSGSKGRKRKEENERKDFIDNRKERGKRK